MKKYILTIFTLFIATSSFALSVSDLSDMIPGKPEAKPITALSQNDLQIQSAAMSINNFFDTGSIVNITPEQKAMLKSSYDLLKAQDIQNPELKPMVDKAINLIDSSGVLM